MDKENQKISLLIVDDEPSNLKILLELLKSDYNIRVATSGERAIAIAMSETPPDLILLDVMMPEMDGYDICIYLKNKPETRNIPVIFVTAKTDTESIIKGFNVGAIDYVTKPFREQELLPRIKTHVSLLLQQKALDDYARLLEEKNQQLTQKNAELEELNATKDKFFSIIAHDLRNPVANFVSLVRLLENEEIMKKDKMQIFIKTLKLSVHGLYDLLENLLTWSMSQRGMIKYDPSPIELSEIVALNIYQLNSNAQKKEITLINSIQNDIIAYADKDMINIVVRNLLSNAVKFTNTGGTIEIKAEAEREKIKVIVSDTGIGMSSKTVDKLFHIGNKIRKEGTSGEQGTGLGLIICKEFVEKNGGTIWVESHINKGTKFFFTLPYSIST
ncbi:MAG: hybrid sensor histidine kinase/response regulator [Desulfobacterales bacterium]|nr:hybrid sensor histidine kinase/response regulator [Desulfobacterales bacterium]